MRIAVISDIHGAAEPFSRALANAKIIGYDQLILLGDLFTYGVEPERCRDLAAEAIEKQGAVFIGGNHDQVYTELAKGESAYLNGRPSWLVESILWTWNRIGSTWPNSLTWRNEWVSDCVLFAHANPYGFGDWTYLNSPEQQEKACAAMASLGQRAGVFGHVHRYGAYSAFGVDLFVVGSIGQPRSGSTGVPEWALVDLCKKHVIVERQAVNFDSVKFCMNIQAMTTLTQHTRNHLCKFFQ